MTTFDVTDIFTDVDLGFMQRAIQGGGKIFAVQDRRRSLGLAQHPTQPDTIFLDELSGRIRVIACLDEPPIVLSGAPMPEFPDKHRIIERLRKRMRPGENDDFFIVFGPEEDCRTAVEEIRLRFVDAIVGVPKETRQALIGGYTTFERILPGPDRMYPDTDSPPTRITTERVAEAPRPLAAAALGTHRAVHVVARARGDHRVSHPPRRRRDRRRRGREDRRRRPAGRHRNRSAGKALQARAASRSNAWARPSGCRSSICSPTAAFPARPFPPWPPTWPRTGVDADAAAPPWASPCKDREAWTEEVDRVDHGRLPHRAGGHRREAACASWRQGRPQLLAARPPATDVAAFIEAEAAQEVAR